MFKQITKLIFFILMFIFIKGDIGNHTKNSCLKGTFQLNEEFIKNKDKCLDQLNKLIGNNTYQHKLIDNNTFQFDIGKFKDDLNKFQNCLDMLNKRIEYVCCDGYYEINNTCLPNCDQKCNQIDCIQSLNCLETNSSDVSYLKVFSIIFWTFVIVFLIIFIYLFN